MLENSIKKVLAVSLISLPLTAAADTKLMFTESWRNWHSGTVETELDGGAEIVAYDKMSQKVFVTNSENNTIDVLNSVTGSALSSINLASYWGAPNSVAAYNGMVAVAFEDNTKTNPGRVMFFDADSGDFKQQVTVGALPDMLTFTADGSKVVVANEGEANNGIDPEGSVSIIDLSKGVMSASVETADFSSFNANRAALKASGVRIFDSAASVAQDLEPEYVAISGGKAYVTLQENNALAIVDLATSTVTDVVALGTKDHSLAGNGLDASDKKDEGNIQNYKLQGMYQPDAISAYEVGGKTFVITANEGDSRDEDVRMKDANLDPSVALVEDGRIEISAIDGDTDGDGDIDVPHSYGGRSFSIWDAEGGLVFDSGDALEQLTIDFGTFVENRSDNKGPEPEGVVIGEFNDMILAFIGLERAGGIAVYNVTDPNAPALMDYIVSELDISPEGLEFVSAADSADGKAFLLIASEVSGTTVRYDVTAVPLPASIWFMISAVAGLALKRKRS